jgi:hypothetical protein
MDQRMGIKKIILAIEDANTGIYTKQQHAWQIYGELKTTKHYAEDETKLRNLLSETQKIASDAENENINLIGVSPVAVSSSLSSHKFETENHRTAWMAIFYDLEGEYLV